MSPNPYDARDEQEHAEVAALLNQLPSSHPAHDAHNRGAGTIELTHLVTDRSDLVEGLKNAYLAGWQRVLTRTRGFRS